MTDSSLPARWWWVRHAPVRDLPADGIAAWDAPADLDRLRRLRLPAGARWLSSPQPRALATARALAPTGTPIALEPRFAEQDFGDWAGRTHGELWQSGDAAYRGFWRDPAGLRPPGGESVQDHVARLALALAEYRSPGDIVAVAHAGTIRAALMLALDLAPLAGLRFALAPGRLTRIDRVAGAWRVVMVNGGDWDDE